MPQIPEPGMDELRCVVNPQNARFEGASLVRPNYLLMHCNIWILFNRTGGWRPETIRSCVPGFNRFGGVVSPTFHCMARAGSAGSIVDGTKNEFARRQIWEGGFGQARCCSDRLFLTTTQIRSYRSGRSKNVYTCSFLNELVCIAAKAFIVFRRVGLTVGLLALTLFSIAPAHAQESRASLGGRFTDSGGSRCSQSQGDGCVGWSPADRDHSQVCRRNVMNRGPGCI